MNVAKREVELFADLVCTRRSTLPGFGKTYGGKCIDEPIAVVGAVVKSTAIPVAACSVEPGGGLRALNRTTHGGSHVAGAVGQNSLHISPAEGRIGFEHQRDDATHHRGRGRRSTERRVVVAALIPVGAGSVGGHDLAGSAES